MGHSEFLLLVQEAGDLIREHEEIGIQVIDDIAHHVRKQAKTLQEMAEANATITKFNELLKKHGIPKITTMFDLTAPPMTKVWKRYK